MRITIIGTGYVGLVTGACLAELGIEVACVDQDQAKIAKLKAGEIPIYEPGLDELVQKNLQAGRLYFSTKLNEAMAGSKVIFITVGTPTNQMGNGTDLSAIYNVAKSLKDHLTKDMVVVIKSTVPVGTTRQVAKLLATNAPFKPQLGFNPEFLREGYAISDFMNPARIVIGSDSELVKQLMRTVYAQFLAKTQFLETSIESAEMIKYASNAFLATKIAFINEMADICEVTGADITHVAEAMGLDDRIGNKFLNPGPGFGGSCFPKDVKALEQIALTHGLRSMITEAVLRSNEARIASMKNKILTMIGNVSDKTIACLGVSFKANTDDIRESPALRIIQQLLEEGLTIKIFDPAGMKNASNILKGNIKWCQSIMEAAENSDALSILTEWEEFGAIDLRQLHNTMRQPVIIDLRNILKHQNPQASGFTYYSVGSQ
jgi:UDPglucose 6-dehydrogenase